MTVTITTNEKRIKIKDVYEIKEYNIYVYFHSRTDKRNLRFRRGEFDAFIETSFPAIKLSK